MSATADHLPILAALREILANDRELWAYDDIARYSKLDRHYIANNVTLMARFPKPIRLGGKKTSHPRWVKAEVIAWFESQTESA